jgi:hypothetical protein
MPKLSTTFASLAAAASSSANALTDALPKAVTAAKDRPTPSALP